MTGGGEIPCPSPETSVFFELMDFTHEISIKYKVTPFEIFKQDKDEVIMLLNYFIEKSNKEEPAVKTKNHFSEKQDRRIRVNDKTASGGWW